MKIGLSIAAIVALAGSASAGSIRIQEAAVGGATFVLNSGNLAPQVFSAASPSFSNGALGFVHTQLANSGINTNDIITVMAGDTDDGLALFALIDQESGGFIGHNSRMDLVAVADDENNNGITGWVNDNSGELIQTSNQNPISGVYNWNTTFQWDNRATGDAFAMSQLDVNDSGSLVFNTLAAFGTTGVARGFQYVSFVNGQWTVVGTGTFNPQGASTSFDWQVIPLPGVGAMGLAGLAVIGVRRRRAM
jgi:hypothetical protein